MPTSVLFFIKKGFLCLGEIISKFNMNDEVVMSTLVSTEIQLESARTDSYMNYFCKKGFSIAY